jgi:hypothetical protein
MLLEKPPIAQLLKNFPKDVTELEGSLPCSQNKKNLRGLSPQANYTEQATPACRRS